LSYLGLVIANLGLYSKASQYFRGSIGIFEELEDRVGMARDYTNIGFILQHIGNNKEALDYLNKALEIDEELDDRIGIDVVFEPSKYTPLFISRMPCRKRVLEEAGGPTKSRL
jgi:tetratricopeptide (TPR) repeat protein